MNFLMVLFLLFNPKSFSWNSCQEKLEKKVWPVDCFISLNIRKYSENSRPYNLLNEWCILNKENLIQINPPKALFSLHLPASCKNIALKTKQHFESIQLVEGSFLNTFL